MARALLAAFVVLLLGFITVTYAALEGGGVVTALTVDPASGEQRKTHIWFVSEGKEVLLEAGAPDSPWVRDLADGSTLTLVGEGIDGRYDFRIRPGGHDRIRSLMRAKYGWRDEWVELLFDVSHSQLVEIERTEN